MNDLLINFAATLLIGPTPIWQDLPDVSGLFAANAVPSLTLEARPYDPATKPSIDSLLALPDGFRAPGYDALTIQRVRN